MELEFAYIGGRLAILVLDLERIVSNVLRVALEDFQGVGALFQGVLDGFALDLGCVSASGFNVDSFVSQKP